jgi:hypothetical protein
MRMLKIRIYKKDLKILVVFFLISLGLTISHASNSIFGWIGPTEDPPGGNVTFQTSCEKILGILVCEEGYMAECVVESVVLGEIGDSCVENADCGESPYGDTDLICDSYDDTCRIPFNFSCGNYEIQECKSDGCNRCCSYGTCSDLGRLPPPPGYCDGDVGGGPF